MSDSPIFDNAKRSNVVTNSPEYVQLADELDAVSKIAYEQDKVIQSSELVPNVQVENPNTRRVLTTVAGIVGAVLGTVIVIDLATPAFDLAAWTDPITAGFLYLSSVYGITVTLPNTPKRHG